MSYEVMNDKQGIVLIYFATRGHNHLAAGLGFEPR